MRLSVHRSRLRHPQFAKGTVRHLAPPRAAAAAVHAGSNSHLRRRPRGTIAGTRNGAKPVPSARKARNRRIGHARPQRLLNALRLQLHRIQLLRCLAIFRLELAGVGQKIAGGREDNSK